MNAAVNIYYKQRFIRKKYSSILQSGIYFLLNYYND